jgi:hypothetical protein
VTAATHRTAEEISFAFASLLALPLARPEAARRFQLLWDEANEGAYACFARAPMSDYVVLLKDMDKRWRLKGPLH